MLSRDPFTPPNLSNSRRWDLTKSILTRASICVQKYTSKKNQNPEHSMLITLSRQMMSVHTLLTREQLLRVIPPIPVKIQSLLAII